MENRSPLPPQPHGVPWPTQTWPQSAPDADVDLVRAERAVSSAFAPPDSASHEASHGETLALVVIHRGRLVLERYASDRTASDTFPSWSMAKSVLHALTGLVVGNGRIALDAPAPVPEWSGPGDPRNAITLEHLLRMVDGLDYVEADENTRRADVVDMIGGVGRDDVAAYARGRRPLHAPGSHWSYSSAASNIVSSILGDVVGPGRAPMEAFLRDALLGPLGMRSAKPRFDAAGTFIGSSYLYATARDFARFGLLYLRDGIWEDERILPEGWVDHARTETPASIGRYGAHWWLAQDGSGIFTANGFLGQHIVIDPARDLVVVRLGVSNPAQRVAVAHGLRDLVGAFPRQGAAIDVAP